jgi:type IV pilus assembly protein PilC
MSKDEFAFFNQQLAMMLRDGIPLEGAIKQLCAGMGVSPLRAELQQLEEDLARGTPLKEALAKRKLPEFYVRMVEIGVRANDLPGMLTLLADYYHRSNALWTRFKGLMVYPIIVIIVSLGLTLLVGIASSRFMNIVFVNAIPDPARLALSMWIPPIFLGLVAIAILGGYSVPGWRARLRWMLPAFREASLAQMASAVTLMLRNGTTLTEALALAESLESGTPAARTLARWRAMIEAGHGKPEEWIGSTKPFPPLFVWIVQNSGENVTAGFQKAADIYLARAAYRIELALYGALPVSILLLGLMVFWQVVPLVRTMTGLMNTLGSSD